VYGNCRRAVILTLLRCAVLAAGAMQQAADPGRHHGGVMRIARAIIIPAILALSTAGSILVASGVPAVAAPAHSTHVVAAAPKTFYHS